MSTITTAVQPNITSTEAKLELMILNSQTNQLDWVDMATLLHSRGAPLELVTRMEDLWEKTKVIAGKVVNIGRVIIMKIWEFIKANPHMVIGAILGAAFGALVGLIPWIGPLLAPIAMTIGITIGMLNGHRLDKIAEGQHVQYSLIEDLITVAKRFFHLIADIFLALRNEYFANGFSS
ncbi:hypothetical protein [Chromatium okenii]|uniref:hypothetical protein n=1 Tax=Chromatium okenii TaxID=61644 RepID=UPI0026EE36C3|nr:hypothetical protein [Chromatium okenii]MBV5308640.1 DUF2273 domain-containing protein [Chromatium okenii]